MKDKLMFQTTNKRVKVYQLCFVIFFFILYSLFPILNPPNAAAAAQTLRVSPVIMNVPLSPGKTITQEVTIENLTKTPLPLRASLNDFVTGGEEGGYVFENTRTNPLLSWIELSDEDFLLDPKEKKKITMTITMPSKIPVGGYYGILFFEPVTQSSKKNATQINTKVGVLLLANLGVPDNGKKRADILTFTPSLLSQDGTVPFLLRVQNTSLNFFTAKPILKLDPLLPSLPLLSQQSPTTQSIYLEEKLIFPDKVRRWTEDQTIHDLSPNIYKVHLDVATGNGQAITTERYVIVFPVMKAVLTLLALLFVIFLITKRKRLSKAGAALFRS